MRASGKFVLSDKYVPYFDDENYDKPTIPVQKYASTATVAMQTALQLTTLQQGTISDNGTIEKDLQTAAQTSYAEAMVSLKTNASLVY
jgi:hypothetical protein